MTKEVVLKYLQKHGQKIDYEIVKDTGIDLKELRKTISELQKASLSRAFNAASQVIHHQQRQAEKHLQHHRNNLD